MAPYVPEEINVFSVPHSRMKELVNSYFTLVSLGTCILSPNIAPLTSLTVCSLLGLRLAEARGLSKT